MLPLLPGWDFVRYLLLSYNKEKGNASLTGFAIPKTSLRPHFIHVLAVLSRGSVSHHFSCISDRLLGVAICSG